MNMWKSPMTSVMFQWNWIALRRCFSHSVFASHQVDAWRGCVHIMACGRIAASSTAPEVAGQASVFRPRNDIARTLHEGCTLSAHRSPLFMGKYRPRLLRGRRTFGFWLRTWKKTASPKLCLDHWSLTEESWNCVCLCDPDSVSNNRKSIRTKILETGGRIQIQMLLLSESTPWSAHIFEFPISFVAGLRNQYQVWESLVFFLNKCDCSFWLLF